MIRGHSLCSLVIPVWITLFFSTLIMLNLWTIQAYIGMTVVCLCLCHVTVTILSFQHTNNDYLNIQQAVSMTSMRNFRHLLRNLSNMLNTGHWQEYWVVYHWDYSISANIISWTNHMQDFMDIKVMCSLKALSPNFDFVEKNQCYKCIKQMQFSLWLSPSLYLCLSL